MIRPSVVPAPSLGLSDDLHVGYHTGRGTSLVTGPGEPVVVLTLYAAQADQGLTELANITATPTAARRLRDALTTALEGIQ